MSAVKVRFLKEFREETTHALLGNFFMLSRFVGFFPMKNFRDSNPEKIGFDWVSLRMAYSLIVVLVFLYFAVLKFFDKKVAYMNFPVFISVSILFSIEISKKWKPFILKLYQFEVDFFAKYSPSRNLKKRINIMIIFLSIITNIVPCLITLISLIVMELNSTNNYSKHLDPFNDFIITLVYPVFRALDWNYILIIILCIVFSSHLKQLSDCLKKEVATIRQEKIFLSPNIERFKCVSKQIRTDYNKLVDLLMESNEILAKVVICSYCSNIYLILRQLNDLCRLGDTQRPFATVGVMFIYISGMSILKIIILTNNAEEIRRNSKGFINIILDVPNEFNNTSLKRLLTQIQFDPATLTGGNMFNITKSSLIQIAVSVLTYEVVINEFTK